MQHNDQIYSQEFQLIPYPDFGGSALWGIFPSQMHRSSRSYLRGEKIHKGSVHIC